MDLKTVKSYDNSWWLKHLELTTVYDAKNIKEQFDWLIEQAEQLDKIKKLSNAEDMTLADFSKEVLRIIESREKPTKNTRQ